MPVTAAPLCLSWSPLEQPTDHHHFPIRFLLLAAPGTPGPLNTTTAQALYEQQTYRGNQTPYTPYVPHAPHVAHVSLTIS
jgi:hypothetical protein